MTQQNLDTVPSCRLEERADDGSRSEGTLEMIAERQKELRNAVLGMEAQVKTIKYQGLVKLSLGGKAFGRRERDSRSVVQVNIDSK